MPNLSDLWKIKQFLSATITLIPTLQINIALYYMTDLYIVQSWGYKKTNMNDNDDVEILGVYRDLNHARQFVNSRFAYYLSDHHRLLTSQLFPKHPRRLVIKQYLKRRGLDNYAAEIVLKYLYPKKNLIPLGSSIPSEIWSDSMTIWLRSNLTNFYLKLMELQHWVSGANRKVKFPDYGEIKVKINTEISGIIRRMSQDTCRVRLFDHFGTELPITLYLGNNLIDLEDCDYRENHYCYSFRIYTKLLRD